MTESDKKYYERKEQQDAHREKVLSKTRARGNAAVEWFKTNKLTPSTKPEFDKEMRRVDREFDATQKLKT